MGTSSGNARVEWNSKATTAHDEEEAGVVKELPLTQVHTQV